MRRNSIGIVALVFGLALALRLLAMAWAFDPGTAFGKFPLLAQRLIADGWVAREPFGYSPAYIYFLAVLIRSGSPAAGLCIAQVVLGALTCVLIWDLTRRLYGPVEAAVAGFLAAILGPFLVFSIELESDGLGLFLYCAAATTLLAALNRPALWRFAVAGLFLGLRAAQRPDALLLAAILAVAIWIAARRGWPALAAPVSLVAACLVPVLPIALQNVRASGEIIPVTSSGGWVFYTSQNHAATGLSYFPPPLAYTLMNAPAREGSDPIDRLDDRVSRRLASLAAGRDLLPGEASRFWTAEAMRSMRRRGALRQISLQARKLYYALHAYEGHDNLSLLITSERLGALTILGMGILAPLALLGLAVTRGGPALRPSLRLPVVAFLLMPVLSMSLFYVGSRFRLELEAMLLPFAAAALVWLGRQARARRWRPAAAAATAIVILGILLHAPDREIARQRRLRFIQLHTLLGGRDGIAGGAETELNRAVSAALYPAEAEEAWRGLARMSRVSGDAAAGERYDAIASGLLDDATRVRLEARRDDPDALWAVGRHLMLRGEMTRAAEALAGATRLAPDDPDVLFSKSVAAFEAGTAPPESVAAWTEEALRIGLRYSPNAVAAYRLMARCHEQLGQRDAAEAALREAARFEAFGGQ
jgi:tetratricopeptide (TPR) repeat protein